VGDAGLDLTGLGQAEVVAVLAHEARVVGEAHRVVGREADDVPVVGHLAGKLGIEAERTAAHLVDGGRRRHPGQVDQDVDRAGVPAFAEQAPGADQAATAPVLEVAGHAGQVAPRLPGALGGTQLDHVAPFERLKGEAVLEVGGEVAGRSPGAGNRLAGHQDRVQLPRGRVGEECPEDQPRAAGLGVEDAAEVGRPLAARLLEVAEDERPEPGAERTLLGRQDLRRGHRLARREEQDAIDGRHRGANAVVAEREAEARQGRPDHLPGGEVGGGPAAPQVADASSRRSGRPSRRRRAARGRPP